MKEDTQWRLRDSEGKEYIVIDSKKVDLQEELNKTIVKQQEEIERLKNKVKEINEEMCYQINLKTENANEIKRLNNIITELSEKNRNLIEDNMRLRKELNLHSGKLVITDLEVKEVWK